MPDDEPTPYAGPSEGPSQPLTADAVHRFLKGLDESGLVGGRGSQGMFLRQRPGQAPAIDPPAVEAFKTLATPEGEYRVSGRGEDVRGQELAREVGGFALVGSMPFPRPAGSVGMFIGLPQAESLALRGRPTAKLALEKAERLEKQGIPHNMIRAAIHTDIKNAGAGEADLGTVFKPDLPGAPWMIEVSTQKPGFTPPSAIKPQRRLGDIYKHETLTKAHPGFEDIEVNYVPQGRPYHKPGELGSAPPLLPKTPSQIGVRRSQTGATGISKEDLFRELQNEFIYANQWPFRGGRVEEFLPGGNLAHHTAPGSKPSAPFNLYNRLFGVMLAKLSAERGNMSGAQLRKESVQDTMKRLQMDIKDAIQEEYHGQRIETHAEDTRLGYLARRAAVQATKLVDDMKAQGASPEKIAAELNRTYGGGATAEDVTSGKGWWVTATPPPPGPHRWTTETSPGAYTQPEKALVALLHKRGVGVPEIRGALEKLSGRKMSDDSLRAYIRRHLGEVRPGWRDWVERQIRSKQEREP